MHLDHIFTEKERSLERIFFAKGESQRFEPFQSELWLIKKGRLTLIPAKGQKVIIEFGQVFFLPPGFVCMTVSEQSSHCIRLLLPDGPALCEKFFFPGLIQEKKKFHSPFNPIRMLPLVWEYTRHLDILFEECILTPTFKKIKVLELFHILSHSYSKHELAGLFFPILKSEDTFAHFVEENYPRLKTVRELACEANMSRKSFENKFNYIFGIPPGRWIIRKKIQMVYEEIIFSPLPLTVIADKCGFATLSHMTDFCKKHIGETPSQIRKGRIL